MISDGDNVMLTVVVEYGLISTGTRIIPSNLVCFCRSGGLLNLGHYS
jgi:hypothetical protein